MIVNCNFVLEAWLRNVQIEVDKPEDAQYVLSNMSIADLMEAGGDIKASRISEVEADVVSAVYVVKATNIDYDIDEINDGLPQELTVEVEVSSEDDLDYLVADEISYKTGTLVNSVDYEIIEVK